MNTYKHTLSVPSRAVEKMYLTKITVYGTIVFNGKIFVMPYQTQVTFDLTDIFANYMFNGAGILKPTYVASNTQAYVQPNMSITNLSANFATHKELIRIPYSIIIMDVDTGSSVSSGSGTAYLRGSLSNNSRMQQRTWRMFDSTKPVSHYPTITSSSNPLRWGNTMSQTSNSSIYVYKKNGNSYTNLAVFSGVTSGDNVLATTVYNLRNISGEDFYVQDNGVYKVAGHIDSCNAPIYLLWVDNDGAIASQRFTNTSEYSEAITVNTRVSSDDTTYTANQFVEGKWKLKSYNLTDDEYEYYMTMINSPYILLYDSEKQQVKYVRITDKSVTRKRLVNNKKKPVYMEINLQETTPKNYIA